MAAKEEVRTNQTEKIELSELTQHEWMVVLKFRQLDDKSRADIIRFLDVFLNMR